MEHTLQRIFVMGKLKLTASWLLNLPFRLLDLVLNLLGYLVNSLNSLYNFWSSSVDDQFNEVARQFATFGFSPQGDLAERHGAYEQTFRPGKYEAGNETNIWATRSVRVACMPDNFEAEFRVMLNNEFNRPLWIDFRGCICQNCNQIPNLVRKAVEKLDELANKVTPTFPPDEDVLDWDASLEVPPPRPGGTIKARLKKEDV
ncbi:MAG: hypothetical protein AAB672_02255 [Patescibacteria group bacterium]